MRGAQGASAPEGDDLSIEDTQRAGIREEIACIVASARRNGRTLRTARHAASLFAAFPGANFSIGRIIDEIVLEAAAHGVALEIGRPGDPSDPFTPPLLSTWRW